MAVDSTTAALSICLKPLRGRDGAHEFDTQGLDDRIYAVADNAENVGRDAHGHQSMFALRALARKKTRAARIAKTLKRSEGATRQKAFKYGCLSLDSQI
jgi:hypothetical protein